MPSGRVSLILMFVIALALLLIDCAPRPPARPSSVPASATWAGGADGGMWYDCSEDVATRSNKCSILFDPGGNLLITARYQLQGSQRAAKKDELRGMTLGGQPWGSVIYLDGNKELHAIEILYYNKDVK
jgi:hypothetical protein